LRHSQKGVGKGSRFLTAFSLFGIYRVVLSLRLPAVPGSPSG